MIFYCIDIELSFIQITVTVKIDHRFHLFEPELRILKKVFIFDSSGNKE
jgi:hypothetical protein